MVKASGNPKTPQFATGALGVPKANVANKSVSYGWSGRGDLNARPPAPKTLDPLICASIDSTTCGPCLLGLVETLAYNLDCKAAIQLVKTADDTIRKSCRKCCLRNSINVDAHLLLRQEGGPLTFGQCGRKTEVRSRLWRERQSL